VPPPLTGVRRSHATEALLAAVGLTLGLYVLPHFVPAAAILARPLVLLSTLAHELGHAMAAVALGGDVESLNVWADASGVAAHRGAYGRFARAAIAAAGPLGPPLAAGLGFLCARRPRAAHVALGVAALILVLVLVFWVRNAFGWLFVGALTAVLGLLAWRGSARVAQVACAFLAIQLCLASFARADYLFSAVARTGAGELPSDTAQIAQALFPPYWLWGGLIALASLAILGLGLRAFARALR
jgi:hypothetical protein